jgi:hypothetical protein
MASVELQVEVGEWRESSRLAQKIGEAFLSAYSWRMTASDVVDTLAKAGLPDVPRWGATIVHPRPDGGSVKGS